MEDGGFRGDPKRCSRPIPLDAQGKIAEQLAPVLPEFKFNPADAKFIGSPVDYIIFEGLTEVSDERQASIRIVFMDVKKGGGSLSRD